MCRITECMLWSVIGLSCHITLMHMQNFQCIFWLFHLNLAATLRVRCFRRRHWLHRSFLDQTPDIFLRGVAGEAWLVWKWEIILRPLNIAIENWPFTSDLPIKIAIFQSYIIRDFGWPEGNGIVVLIGNGTNNVRHEWNWSILLFHRYTRRFPIVGLDCRWVYPPLVGGASQLGQCQQCQRNDQKRPTISTTTQFQEREL